MFFLLAADRAEESLMQHAQKGIRANTDTFWEE